ncbi:hypothetical protein PIB30_039470 [Stylosanthes scabra]|uniref:Uncharacterized protein n=1 Tax=Stylosanthes scabra TaxID=79078 RepID=A0ABU6WCG5_9FABA|nr:hypothetical protein [Stylosanthes scabra]
MQDTTSPSAAYTIPAQPSQNLKSSINALQHETKKKGRHVGDGGKGSYSLYDFIAQLTDSDDEESEVGYERGYNDESGEHKVGSEEDSDGDEDESEEEEENGDWLYDLLVELYKAQEWEKESDDSQSEEESDVEDEIEEVETNNEADKTFFIATLFNNKRVKEEIPAKCEDPGPCLVTCKIKHVVVLEFLCDPGACSSVMPYELYKFLRLGPLKKTEEIFTNADASVVSVVGNAEDVKGKTKLCQLPTRTSPRLAALRSNTAVQMPTPTPDVPVKEAVTSTLPPKKRQNFRMEGESSSRRDTRIPCRRSRRLAVLYSITKPVSEEKVVIEISDDSLQKEDTNLEQNEAEPEAKVGGRVDLPKNDIYDALWAMLDAESDNEAAEMPRE